MYLKKGNAVQSSTIHSVQQFRKVQKKKKRSRRKVKNSMVKDKKNSTHTTTVFDEGRSEDVNKS
jgi:hypothetical protein